MWVWGCAHVHAPVLLMVLIHELLPLLLLLLLVTLMHKTLLSALHPLA